MEKERVWAVGQGQGSLPQHVAFQKVVAGWGRASAVVGLGVPMS